MRQRSTVCRCLVGPVNMHTDGLPEGRDFVPFTRGSCTQEGAEALRGELLTGTPVPVV